MYSWPHPTRLILSVGRNILLEFPSSEGMGQLLIRSSLSPGVSVLDQHEKHFSGSRVSETNAFAHENASRVKRMDQTHRTALLHAHTARRVLLEISGFRKDF
jgi:hypothetical protein